MQKLLTFSLGPQILAIHTCVQDILTNIATLLGADRAQADQDMHDVIAFEIELSMVSEKVNVKLPIINNYVPLAKH